MASDNTFEWLDFPDEGFMGGEWGWGHTIGCFFATCLYVVPGIIFLIWKPIARANYLAKQEEVKKNHEIAFERTGCDYLYSALHLGGHPRLPYQNRVLIGIKERSIIFYSYSLEELHNLPLEMVNVAVKTTQTVSGGSYVTTSNVYTLLWRETINGKVFDTEFNMTPYSPESFVDTINKLSV
ncbi:hypothetical protein [Levilinea saccharolytica]|uniref:Uncharacterized protein n=1 Tax=Levilinea saccharolytica TaxID=229921 RepID=A0A0M8JQ81_9CHLR|nr:hypothetical protein [Levilinea saccharolytica]GAP19621.1 hypothetical protein LSAC_03531 [Levilinea saccharolytica]